MAQARSRRKSAVIAAFVFAVVSPPLLVAGPAAAAAVCNTTPVQVDIPPMPMSEVRRALPYPSPIEITGLSGTIADVDVSVLHTAHPVSEDMDVLVVAPDGTNLLIMSDAGGDNAAVTPHFISDEDLTFSDEAATFLPANTILTTGTYKPLDDDTDVGEFLPGHADTFYAPAPAPSAATTLSVFDGGNPNGTWSLYMVDDDPGPPTPAPQGFLEGWCIDITMGPAMPVTPIGVFRPSNSQWYVQGDPAVAFGTTGDIQVPGDYNGNGTQDVAVFRPSTGVWYVQGGPTVAWGTSGDIPVPADYDGNGSDEFAVFRPSTGVWYVQGGATAAWGASGDIPVPGDYDGNGTDEFAVFRPSTSTWFVSGGATTVWGTTGDIPVPGDYTGNGTTDVAVFRPSTGTWFVSGGGSTAWGTSGDIPVPGDYDGSGTTDVAVFRPSTGVWYIQGGATVGFGTAGDRPLPLPWAIQNVYFP